MKADEYLNEIWRDVKGFEEIYQVSNHGRVKRLSGTGCKSERILRLHKDSDGYLLVQLYKNNKRFTRRVHRLVADAFLPNPNKYPCINHKDEITDNNFVSIKADGTVNEKETNLEWCTYEYNNNYGHHNDKLKRPILQFDLDGNYIKEYNCIKEACEQLKIKQPGHLSLCCLGKRKQVNGFVFKYKPL